MTDDSWLTLIGNILIEADKYLDHLKAQNPSPPTEPAHSDPPKNPTPPRCLHCHEEVEEIFNETTQNRCWIHQYSHQRWCNLMATPQH